MEAAGAEEGAEAGTDLEGCVSSYGGETEAGSSSSSHHHPDFQQAKQAGSLWSLCSAMCLPRELLCSCVQMASVQHQ